MKKAKFLKINFLFGKVSGINLSSDSTEVLWYKKEQDNTLMVKIRSAGRDLLLHFIADEDVEAVTEWLDTYTDVEINCTSPVLIGESGKYTHMN